ncbi:hypothetical protein [Polaribacter aquimarinus]|uniref:Uncharacterized protein n=1 Tax=Polaribacter aquimarinus TaxID=2100726 RepID=A0A2U2JER1_9FLAO|nr:hypothetical protein [Polaribacter aquimarinus]PWG06805.1 hypothetical protein DIS07_02915 [Polaribacter aquimarinus]
MSKYLKLITLSITSLLLYYLVMNSERINATLVMIQESQSSKGLGILILIYIGKWFLLLFGILGLLYFLFELLKQKKDL